MSVVLFCIAVFLISLGIPAVVVYHEEISKKLTPEWKSIEKRCTSGKKILSDLTLLHDMDGGLGLSDLPGPYKRKVDGWLEASERYYSYRSEYAGNYRELAQILFSLRHPTDINKPIPVLPPGIDDRIDRWLNNHRRALSAKALSR